MGPRVAISRDVVEAELAKDGQRLAPVDGSEGPGLARAALDAVVCAERERRRAIDSERLRNLRRRYGPHITADHLPRAKR